MNDFQTTYERYATDVHRFALYLSGDPALAEDLTSEAFVRLWSSNEEIRFATVKSYLFTIARNLYVDGLRKNRRQVGMDNTIPDPASSPESRAQDRDELRAVLQALKALPEVDRTALLLRAQQGFTYLEIAHFLGLSEAAVKVKIHRSRIKLSVFRQASGDREARAKHS